MRTNATSRIVVLSVFGITEKSGSNRTCRKNGVKVYLPTSRKFSAGFFVLFEAMVSTASCGKQYKEMG